MFRFIDPVEELGGQIVARKSGTFKCRLNEREMNMCTQHVPPHPFTRRLGSLLTLVPRFTLDQPTSSSSLEVPVWGGPSAAMPLRA